MRNHLNRLRKTALITGASSGIGYELTKLFVRDGFNVVLVARDEGRLIEFANELGRSFDVRVTVVPKDLSDPRAAEELYRELLAREIEIDVLVNNAGFGVYGAFSDTDSQQELRMMQVNMITLTQLTKLFLPSMLRRNSGKILNVASTASFTPGPYDAVYCASKAYVLSFSEAIAEELRGTGVTVTTLCPGPTNTEFAERSGMTDTKIFKGRVTSAAQVAQAGYRALMEERTTVLVGLGNKLLVFSLRFTPRTLIARIARNLLSRGVSTHQASARPAH